MVIMAGFVAAATYHYVNGAHFNLSYPYTSFLPANNELRGWFSLQGVAFDPYQAASGIRRAYFPFLYLITSVLFLIGEWPSYWFITLSFIGFFVAYLWRPLQDESVAGTIRNVLIYTFLSYPVLFALDLADLAMWIFILSGSFLLLYRKQRYYAAATMLALAMACQPFTIVLLALLLFERRFLEACYSVGLAGVLTLGSLLLFKGAFRDNLSIWIASLGADQIRYAIGYQGLPFGHSFFEMWKYVYLLWSPQTFTFESVSHLAGVYGYVAVFLLLALCGFIVWRRKSLEIWEVVGLLVVAEVCLPYVSPDFTLLQCYLPMLLFIESDRQAGDDWIIAVLFGLLMIPKHYDLLNGTELGIGVIINPILLLSLAGIIMVRPKALPQAASAAAASYNPLPFTAPPLPLEPIKDMRDESRRQDGVGYL